MATTAGLGLHYPTENEDPFHVTHATGMTEIDLFLRCALEDASSVLVGGGDLELAANIFSWSAAFYLIAGRSNAVATIPASSITLLDGHVAWLSNVTRPLTTDVYVAVVSGAAGPAWDCTKIPLFRRTGSNVWCVRQALGLGVVTVEL
jgi:hypothetical protein